MGNSDVLHLGWDSEISILSKFLRFFLRQITCIVSEKSQPHPFSFLYSIISNLIFLVNVHASGTHLLPHALGAMCVVLGDRDR